MGCGESKEEAPASHVADNNTEMKIVVLGVGGVGTSNQRFHMSENQITSLTF